MFINLLCHLYQILVFFIKANYRIPYGTCHQESPPLCILIVLHHHHDITIIIVSFTLFNVRTFEYLLVRAHAVASN